MANPYPLTTEFDPNGKIVIFSCNPGEMKTEMAASANAATILDGKEGNRHIIESLRYFPAGGLMGYYRSTAVMEFLKDFTAEWMMFIDSDIEFTLEDIYALYDTAQMGYLVCSGLYINQMGKELKPCIWDLGTEIHTITGQTVVNYKTRGTFFPGVTEATGLPGGFLLMHRSVLTAVWNEHGPVANAWFAEHNWPGYVFHGEDLTFSRRVHELGYKMAVNCDIQLTHHKGIALHPQMVKQQQQETT